VESIDDNLNNSVMIIENNNLIDQDIALIPKKKKYINGINSAVRILIVYYI